MAATAAACRQAMVSFQDEQDRKADAMAAIRGRALAGAKPHSLSLLAQDGLNHRKMNGWKTAQDDDEEEDRGFGEDGFPLWEGEELEYVRDSEAGAGEEYRVVFDRIAIRKKPSAEGRVIGAADRGEVLTCFDWDETRTWRKIHFRLRGGWGSNVAAWVMVRHPEIGTLLRSTAAGGEGAGEEPTPALAVQPATRANQNQALTEGVVVPLTSADLDDVAREVNDRTRFKHLNGEEEDAGAKDGIEDATGEDIMGSTLWCVQYQVVHKPFVAVRSKPDSKGTIVRSVEYGTFVDTFGWDKTRTWRKIFCKMGTSNGNPRYIVAWMLTTQEKLGTLLEPVAG